jgi:hypothetical protein
MTDQENNYYFKKLREDLYAHYKEWEDTIPLEQINSKNIKEKGLGVLTTDLNGIVEIFSTESKNETEKATTPISLGTLKGFYGVDKNYKSFPNPHTLNIISIYLGYQDWSDYIMKNKADKTTIEQATEMKQEKTNEPKEEKNYPKTWEEFKKYLIDNKLSDIFEMIDDCFESMKNQSEYNAMKRQYESDKYEHFTENIKDRLKTLVGKKYLA